MEPITTILIVVCIGFGIGLLVLYSKYTSRSKQLEQEKATHTQKLTETQQQLEEEQHQTTSLKGELTETQQQLEEEQRQTTSLKGELTETQQQLNKAEEQREDLLQYNKKARWILYLSMASLQSTGGEFLKEQEKTTDLCEKYKKLIGNYKGLHQEVKSKARRRLLKKGGEVILSFIPGLSLVPLLSDVSEILEVISATDAVVEGLGEELNILEDSNTDVTHSKLTPIVHPNITDVLQQKMSVDNADAEQDPDAFNTFAVRNVRGTENFIESELAEKYPESIRVALDDLEEFIDELFEYHQTMGTMKENPPPTKGI